MKRRREDESESERTLKRRKVAEQKETESETIEDEAEEEAIAREEQELEQIQRLQERYVTDAPFLLDPTDARDALLATGRLIATTRPPEASHALFPYALGREVFPLSQANTYNERRLVRLAFDLEPEQPPAPSEEEEEETEQEGDGPAEAVSVSLPLTDDEDDETPLQEEQPQTAPPFVPRFYELLPVYPRGSPQLETYLMDLGFPTITETKDHHLWTFLWDRSHVLTPPGAARQNVQYLAGVVHFGDLTFGSAENKTHGTARLEVIGLHPLYRGVGNVGCVLLKNAERLLLERMRAEGMKSVRIYMPDVVFPDLRDDSVYHFFRRNGYELRQYVPFLGNLAMGKTVAVPPEEAKGETKETKQQQRRQSLGEQCAAQLLAYETSGAYDDAVADLERKLINASSLRQVYSLGGGRSVELTQPPDPSAANRYLAYVRSPAYIERRLDRIARAAADTETERKEAVTAVQERLEAELADQPRQRALLDAELLARERAGQAIREDFQRQEQEALLQPRSSSSSSSRSASVW